MVVTVSDPGMGISELAARAGVTPRTIRYYVAEGLLPSPGGRGQRRSYSEEHLARLERIRELKAAYLPLHEIRRQLGDPEVAARPGATAHQLLSPHSTVRVASGSSEAASPTVTRASAVGSQAPGIGGGHSIGRIELYEPIETVWHRHTIAPGIELHYRETDNPHLAAAIQRLIREAGQILDADDGRAARRKR